MFKTKTHYSLNKSIITSDSLANLYKEYGFKVCPIIDINNICSSVQHVKACKKHELKPVIGTEITLKEQGSNLRLIARNLEGFRALNIIVGLANKQLPIEISLEEVQSLSDNLLIIGPPDLKDKFSTYFVENEVVDYDCRYLTQDQHIEFQVVTAIGAKSTIRKCNERGYPLYKFFAKNQYYVRTKEQLLKEFSREQILNTNKLFELVEEFNFLQGPQLPKFECPNGVSSDAYLLKKCTDGFNIKLKGKNKEKYIERLDEELGVFKEAGLADYFLIVADIFDFCKEKKYLTGVSRGSVGGCLVAYLLDITKIDPLQYKLIFSRFYNKGRKGSLPDIDFDIPKFAREDVINYVVGKYGKDKVSHIATYQTLKGRSSLKAVFRAFDMPFSEINRITENIEDEAKIADELNEEQSSIVYWALQNKPECFREWCNLNEDGTLGGTYANEFQMAINLEETKMNQAKHASGIIVATQNLNEIVPMIYDKNSKRQIVGYEMDDASSIGLLKIDILGLSSLDRIMDIQQLVGEQNAN